MSAFTFHLPDFAFSFLSILMEGVPFLLLGALISGAIEAFLPPGLLQRVLPKHPALAIALSGLMGSIFPMCECGSVVVIRRFLLNGLPVSCAVTYMLASPIVSPIVALSTFTAFRGQHPWEMTLFRLGFGYVVAILVGLVVHRLPLGAVLQPRVREAMENKANIRARLQAADTDESSSRWLKMLRATTSDFLDVALFFVIGAALAAVFNTAFDQALIQPLATRPLASILTMMALAAAMALCSSTDAFIAASLMTFPFAAKLAFLVFGPVFDVKLFFLYSAVFRRRFIGGLALGLLLFIGLLCLRLFEWGVR
jgi:hypothetical protein